MRRFFRFGVITGLIAAVGFNLAATLGFDMAFDLSQVAFTFAAGLGGGVLLGLLLCLLLTLLRGLDRATGWKVASRLEAFDPGPAGWLLALVTSIPCALFGCISLSIVTIQACAAGKLGFPPSWALVSGLIFVPLAALVGGGAGAALGSAIGALVVGVIRAVVSPFFRKKST